MADISKVKVGSTDYDLKDTTARSGISGATTNSYPITLIQSNWTGSGGGPFTYIYNGAEMANIRATHPPLITCTNSDKSDYNLFLRADAYAGEKIVFQASAKPSGNINLIVIDVG